MDLSWMAWTPPVAVFFSSIALLLVIFTIWEIAVPGGAARHGILGFTTTRGDRLFISLLGTAYICIFWLAFTSQSLWWALALALVYSLCVFIWV